MTRAEETTAPDAASRASSAVCPENPKTKGRRKRKRCAVSDCGAKVCLATSLSNACRWCEREFCSLHRLPEAHACANIGQCRAASFQANADTLRSSKCAPHKI